MFTLANDQLLVELLDPVADRARMGARYCTGGYIFQITDPEFGPLLASPTGPDDFNWFDGHGIPDAFNLNPLRALDSGREALIIGVGMVMLDDDRLKVAVNTFCDWTVTVDGPTAVFTTRQSHAGWDFILRRTVTLLGRTVRSHTQLENRGQRFLPVCWFPHPFYPQPDGDALLKLNCPMQFKDNPGYEQMEDGTIGRIGWPWSEGTIWRWITTPSGR